VLESVSPLVEANPKLAETLPRLLEPERVIQFRVAWVDDQGHTRVNRGFRVQMNQTLGPYKGGLRFHPTVNLSVLKFLALEQTFKNALTGLSLGAAKGGSDFDPKGKSDGEVMRFCQSFMTELAKHIGPDVDVPAGDIGVGGRELGYLFGQYKRLSVQFNGVLTGKGPEWGGSNLRPEATGYGAVYFLMEMLGGERSLADRRVALSGSGNVAQYASECLIKHGAIPVTMSDSGGTLIAEGPLGFAENDSELLKLVMEVKNIRRGRLADLQDVPGLRYVPGVKPWQLAASELSVAVAMPCATQNELDEEDAAALVRAKFLAVVEGANMPTTTEACKVLKDGGVNFAPGKAANAGGVAVSGLEMAQNATYQRWTREEVDDKLKSIMANIHTQALAAAEAAGSPGDLRIGADCAGFLRVSEAMISQGVL